MQREPQGRQYRRTMTLCDGSTYSSPLQSVWEACAIHNQPLNLVSFGRLIAAPTERKLTFAAINER